MCLEGVIDRQVLTGFEDMAVVRFSIVYADEVGSTGLKSEGEVVTFGV